MESIAPRSVSAPKMAAVSAQAESKKPETASTQMPELKVVSHTSAPASGEKSSQTASQGNTMMEEIAPINKRPSSEIFSANSDNPENPDNDNSENTEIADNPENSENPEISEESEFSENTADKEQ